MEKKEDITVPLLFCEAFSDRSYRYMGAHRKGDAMIFRAKAPHAEQVFLVGDVNSWGEDLPMIKIDQSGIWEIRTDCVLFEGRELYKYKIRKAEGDAYVADPYAFCLRTPPETAGAVYDVDGYEWRDSGFLKRRREREGIAPYEQPLNIYEVCLGSWMRHADGSNLSYRELIFELVPYVKQMGYTHVMLTDAVGGAFSPNPCYGQPKELMALIDTFHEAGIGVMISLSFTGADAAREGADSLLVPSALFWAEYYHIDGILVDGTCRGSYKKLGTCMKKEYPDVLTVAEGATCEDGITYTWNREWSEDILSYVSLDAVFRRYHYGKVSRGGEDMAGCAILPISHDMVTGGKKSFLGKMFGEYKHKFAQARALMVYIMTQPCKKLMFMGGEIGQFREWDGNAVEWFLTEYESHASLQRFFAELGHFYLENPLLYELDNHDGFVQMRSDDCERSVLSYCRVGKDGGELLTVVNFSPVCYRDFEQKVRHAGLYREVLNSDACSYGGEGNINSGDLLSDAQSRIRITLPPYGACVFKYFKK